MGTSPFPPGPRGIHPQATLSRHVFVLAVLGGRIVAKRSAGGKDWIGCSSLGTIEARGAAGMNVGTGLALSLRSFQQPHVHCPIFRLPLWGSGSLRKAPPNQEGHLLTGQRKDSLLAMAEQESGFPLATVEQESGFPLATVEQESGFPLTMNC